MAKLSALRGLLTINPTSVKKTRNQFRKADRLNKRTRDKRINHNKANAKLIKLEARIKTLPKFMRNYIKKVKVQK